MLLQRAACEAAGLPFTARPWRRSDWNRGEKQKKRFGVSNSGSQHKYSLFFFKALLFIHFFFLQQQITEAVLKIKVLFSCSCKKKKKNAQNLNDSTKRSVNMPCKWWGRDITVGKSILPFSIMKTSQYFYISELYHIIWNYIYIKDERNEHVFFVFSLSSVFFFANECYKHINLLNIFISATLFVLSPRYSILFL